MNVKEQENQLRLDLLTRIVVTVLIWVVLVAIAAVRLVTLTRPLSIPPVVTVSVPTIKEENLTTLRTSLKAAPDETTRLPITNPEPFD